MPTPAIKANILKRNRATYNYANLNKKGFTSIKTVQMHKVTAKKINNSAPSSPSESVKNLALNL